MRGFVLLAILVATSLSSSAAFSTSLHTLRPGWQQPYTTHRFPAAVLKMSNDGGDDATGKKTVRTSLEDLSPILIFRCEEHPTRSPPTCMPTLCTC